MAAASTSNRESGKSGDAKKCEGSTLRRVVVLPLNSPDIVTLEVGGVQQDVSHHLLSRIPALADAVRNASASVSASTKYQDVKSRGHARSRFYLEGDYETYQLVFSYARGNRGFLRTLSRSMMRVLRFEAQKLQMDDLVEDLDSCLNPPADPEFVARLDLALNMFGPIVRMPMIHGALMNNNPLYRHVFEFIQRRANEHGISIEDEVRRIIRDFAQCREFTDQETDSLPSIKRALEEHDLADLTPPSQQTILQFLSQFVGAVMQLAGGQMLQNFMAGILNRFQHHAPQDLPQDNPQHGEQLHQPAQQQQPQPDNHQENKGEERDPHRRNAPDVD